MHHALIIAANFRFCRRSALLAELDLVGASTSSLARSAVWTAEETPRICEPVDLQPGSTPERPKETRREEFGDVYDQ